MQGVVQESISDILEEFAAALDRHGVHDGLRFLNGRTAHRFTGLYRFDPPILRSVALFDRYNPDLRIGADARLEETYCSIVGESGVPYFTSDAKLEERLRAHPARDHVISYCGVLLRDEETPFGTLCHFDLAPCHAPTEEIPILEAAAPLIMNRLRSASRPPDKFRSAPA